MKRRDFLSRFGIGAAAVIAAPAIAKEVLAEDPPIDLDYPIQDDIWPSRRWNADMTEYIDLSGELTTTHDGGWVVMDFDGAQREAEFRIQMAMDEQLFMGWGDINTNELIRRR